VDIHSELDHARAVRIRVAGDRQSGPHS
jgi:hypothetical protein